MDGFIEGLDLVLLALDHIEQRRNDVIPSQMRQKHAPFFVPNVVVASIRLSCAGGLGVGLAGGLGGLGDRVHGHDLR